MLAYEGRSTAARTDDWRSSTVETAQDETPLFHPFACACSGCAGLVAAPDDDAPHFFIPPTSGTAANGLPIYDWDQAAAQISRSNTKWGGGALGSAGTVTYAFRSTAPTTMPSDTAGFSRFSEAQIIAAEEAFALWAAVANITFARIGSGTTGEGAYSNSATILLANYSSGQSGAAAFAYFPGSTASTSNAGDVWVNITSASNTDLSFGSYGLQVLEHEIGHAIGLDHPGEYNGGSPTYPADATYWQDARMYSVMSYFGSLAIGGSLPAFSNGPQYHDIAAAQRLYGANNTTFSTNTTYGFNSNTGHQHWTISSPTGGAVFSIWDPGGVDTLDLSGYATASEIDLRPESFSGAGPGNGGGIAVGNISITRGTTIENAIGGGGNDTMYGNSANNLLIGHAGADFIFGDTGDDVITGNDGGDSLSGWTGFDWIEGGGDNDWISAGDGDDRLDGAGGNDTLDGQLGWDTMYGGLGDDVYYVDNAGDDPRENSGEGFDIVYTSVTWAIRANIETVFLAAGAGGIIAFGDAVGNVLVGNDVANVIAAYGGNDWIEGREGNDWLEGWEGDDRIEGGDGADRLDGGLGSDVLIGGANDDSFVYNAIAESSVASYDSIRDFQVGLDKVNLTAVRTGASDSFHFVYAYGNTYLFVDLGGGGDDMLIELQASPSVTASDLIWS